MGYIGAQFQLLMYKNQKADVELKMILRQDDIQKATGDTQDVQKYYSQQLSNFLAENDCNTADEAYIDYKAEVDAQLQMDMADIMTWEEDLNMEQEQDNSQLSLLNTNITNLQSMVQNNIASAHTYGGGSQ